MFAWDLGGDVRIARGSLGTSVFTEHVSEHPAPTSRFDTAPASAAACLQTAHAHP